VVQGNQLTGVAIPFPALVEVGGGAVVVVPPMTLIQTQSPRSRNAHVLPTAGFQSSKLASEIPAFVAIVPHWSPLTTKWKVLQLETSPAWKGVGVVIPLPGAVEVGGGADVVLPPMTLMQTQSPRSRNAQVLPTAGFQSSKLASEIPAFVAMVPHSSPLTTKWKVLQLDTKPAWNGVGVVIPLPAVVVVLTETEVEVVPPMTLMQTKSPRSRNAQVDPTAGFQMRN